MANNNLTIFQKLTKTFGYMGQIKEKSPVFNFDRDEILKTDSREDYEKALLQAQQSQFIADKWSKLDQSLYNQSVYYEPNRLSAYYDYESMEFSLNGDTQIVTLNGFMTIKELADKGRDYEFITYAYDHNKKQVVPALARNAHYTRDEMTYKITFDDGKFIIATYGHRFLKRDGVYCKVEDLKIGDSMMPFYRKSFYKQEKYNWIYTCNSEIGSHGWRAEHTLVAEHMIRPLEKNEVVHHIDFNGKNNLMENLQILDSSEHQSYHATHNNKKLWANPEYRLKMIESGRRTDNKYRWNGKRKGVNNPAYFELSIEDIIESAKKNKTFQNVVNDLKISRPKIRRTINNNGYLDWKDLLEKNKIEIGYIISYKSLSGKDHPKYLHIPWDLLVETALSSKTAQETAKKLNVTWHKINDDIRRAGYNDWHTFINAYDTTKSKSESNSKVVNHKIRSIEPFGVVPVYDLTVPGYKNFATDTIFSHNTPEISASLDIYSEESCTMSEKGEILTIFSESKRIKNILDDLFLNILDVNTNLQMWARGMCKYGDDFVYLKIDPEKGIIGCQQLPNIEIERIEGAASKVPNMSTPGTNPITRELRFAWKNKDMEFQAWEIAHFRILGDDRKLPYGTSMLDKIRRIWKQLLLAEDAMLIYRTSRAPERRVFKVFVGNMDDKDIEPYVQRVANKFKRAPVVDKTNGQVDMRYNQMPVWKNTPIPLLDGRTITIEELSKEYDEGKENWVYSVQDETLQIVPGKVVWCGKNYTAKKLIKIWLDDETWMMTAPEHPFLVFKNEKKNEIINKRADELLTDDSLVPYYEKISDKKENKIMGYKMVYDHKIKDYVFVHRLFNNNIFFGEINKIKETEKQFVIHHKDFLINKFSKLNNYPDNLLVMGYINHIKLHSENLHELWKIPEYREKFLENTKSNNYNIWHGKNSIKNKENAALITKKYMQTDDVILNRSNSLKNKYKTDIVFFNKQKKHLRNLSSDIKNKKIYSETLRETNKKIWSDVDYVERHRKRSSELFINQQFSYKNCSLMKNKILLKTNLNKCWSISSIKKIGGYKSLRISTIIKFFDQELNISDINQLFYNNIKEAFKKYANLNDVLNFFNITDYRQRGIFISRLKTNSLYDLTNGLNHKVSRIEEIFENEDVYCMTVAGINGEDDRHNFAIKSFNIDGTISVSGSFTRNSVDQDYFVPVRDPNQASPIETLPGAQNLGEIADIEYIQKKLLAALRIPKAFLGFEEVVGDGKNLALMDIRFARTINRVQKSLIQELNKIALIHLYLMGMEDELHNFSLSLTNPSAQSDLLRVEQWKEKIQLYKDATSDQSQMGILPVSHTWAKKNILGMSDAEVLLDLQQQRLERAIGFELTNSQTIIKRTGLFDVVDKKYGIPESERQKMESMGASAGPPPPGGGGEIGGMEPMGAGTTPASAPTGGEGPLSESRKDKILSMLGESDTPDDLFNFEKAQRNIYEIENKIKDILND